MSSCIWKYELNMAHTQALWLPRDARILTAQAQLAAGNARRICLWVIVNPDESNLVKREIAILGTGNEITLKGKLTYINTVQFDGGLWVWHVFEWAPGEFSALS